METIICTYKEEQKINTEFEKQRLINSGMVFLNIEDYKELLSTFGLKFEIIGKYYNTANYFGKWLECMCDAIDDTKKSYANIYGNFYQNEIKKETKKYLEFRKFRQNYFSQLKSGHLVCL